MRILFTSYQKGFAGSAYSTVYLALGLKERGHDIFVAGVEGSIIAEKVSEKGIPFTVLTKGFKYWDRNSIRIINDLIIEERIEIVNAQSSRDRYVLAAIKLFYNKGFTLIHTRRQRANSKGLFIQNFIYNRTANYMVAVSEGVKKSMTKIGLDSRKITVIYNGTPKERYNGVNAESVDKLRHKYQLGDKQVIGCVARKKLQIDLLRALQYLPSNLVVVFVGLSRQNLSKELSETMPTQDLIFTGGLSSTEVLHHYPLFDVKVLPSQIEGLSQSLLEAMAMGAPVVATAAAGNIDLVSNSENGFLYEKGNDTHLAEMILKVLAMRSEEKERLIAAGKKTALEDFSIERTVSAYEKFFLDILQ